MSIEARRWVMTAAGAPLASEGFKAEPGPGEAAVAVAGCGLCHTDLGYYYDGVRTKHALPLALGHEVSGRVVATGAGAEAWRGRAVIVPAVIPCGSCDFCRKGRGAICRQQKMPGNDIHGGFASHIVVPARDLCPVDEARLAARGLDLAEVSVVADAVTTPYQAVVRAEIKPGMLAVVVGVGGVGGYAVQIAHAFGAAVVAIDVDADKLEAISRHGAALTLNPKTHDERALKKAIFDFAKARGLPQAEWAIFECSGSPQGQATAFGLLVHGATLCVVGFTMAKVELRLSNLMAFDARAIGNWGCVPELYPGALDLVLDGKIAIKPFVQRHPLESINSVFAEAHAHKLARRPILVPAA
ncbi:MAG: 6-hydroxycyclohex-1-ene-1-carbonyl-CoA dehydrogenase [Alphaproteobacteria bacterium]|nr:6-hydroxycyclohex-1-ene-1-carbonyl-CoA dehydrogenase [Alphaproteobacteria bacterium]